MGVSKVYSPRTIMTGTTLDYAKHCKIPFGSHCQVFQDRSTKTKFFVRSTHLNIDFVCYDFDDFDLVIVRLMVLVFDELKG